MSNPNEIRSKAVPLYQLLTVGRLDRSGDFCPGARLDRDQALSVLAWALADYEDGLAQNDASALDWISRHMPADGSVPQ